MRCSRSRAGLYSSASRATRSRLSFARGSCTGEGLIHLFELLNTANQAAAHNAACKARRWRRDNIRLA